MQCLKCRKESNSDVDHYCEDCGESMPPRPVCPTCQAADYGRNFCWKCGYDYGRKEVEPLG